MKVWITQIDHKHGTDIIVSSNQKEDERKLADYCKYWWNESVNHNFNKDFANEKCPKKRKDIIDRYFEICEEESYETYTPEIRPPQKKTSTLQKNFLKAGGEACPFCGEDVCITGEEVEVVHGGAIQELYCAECEKSWKAIYRLKKFVE